MTNFSGLCIGGELAGQKVENDSPMLTVAKREPLPDIEHVEGSAVLREAVFEYETYELKKIGAGDFGIEVWALQDMSHVDILKELLENYRPVIFRN